MSPVVYVVAFVPPRVSPKVPVVPVKGSPVAFVSVPLAGVPRAPPEVSKVADVGIVVELIVRPLTFVTVAPDAMDVEPKVGAVYPAGGAAHSSPDAVALLTDNKYPLVVATLNCAGVDAPVAAIIEPLAVSNVFCIKLDVSGATSPQEAPLYTFMALRTELK